MLTKPCDKAGCAELAAVRIACPEYGVRCYRCAQHAASVFQNYPYGTYAQTLPVADLSPFVEQLIDTAVVELRVVRGALGTLSEGRAWFAVANRRTDEILTEKVEAEEILCPSIFGPADCSMRPAHLTRSLLVR